MRTNGRQIYSFGVFITAIVFAAFTLTLAACTKEKWPATYNSGNDQQPDSSAATNTISYLALGDSYTIGQAVDPSQRFPVQLVNMLRQRGFPLASPQIIAATGWTTQNLLETIINLNPNSNYRIVTLLIGVNDQYQKRDTIGYRQQFIKCLNKAIELAATDKRRVFVLSIPDYSATPFGQNHNPALIAQQIDWFNNINKQVCTDYNVSYTDITLISKEAIYDSSLTAKDGLHPSVDQYTRWAAMLVPKIAELLK